MEEKKKKGISGHGIFVMENLIFLMFLVMVVIVFVNVVGRFFFQKGITESEELAKILFVWITFIGTVLCFYEGKHIAVDVLLIFLPPKIRKVFDVVSNLLVTVILALVAWYGISFVKTSFGMVSPLTKIPQPVIHLILPVSFVIMIAMNIRNLIDILRCVKEDEK